MLITAQEPAAATGTGVPLASHTKSLEDTEAGDHPAELVTKKTYWVEWMQTER